MKSLPLVVVLLAACAPKSGPNVPAPARIATDPGVPDVCISDVRVAGRMTGKTKEAWLSAVGELREGKVDAARAAMADAGEHPAITALDAAITTLSTRFDLAAPKYGEVLAAYPDEPCVLQAASVNDLLLGERDRGLDRAKRAWELAPDDPNAGFLYGIWLSRSDPPAAEGVLKRVVELQPGHPGANAILGLIEMSRGDAEAAIAPLRIAYENQVSVGPDLLAAYFYAGKDGEYVKLASQMGFPLGDQGRIAKAADPWTEYYAVLGVPVGGHPVAVIHTSMGDIRCELLPEHAPITVANFVGLSRGTQPWTDPHTGAVRNDPLYSGTTFHRVIPEFMIQGGDPLGNGIGGPGYQFHDELDPELKFDAGGVLAMANAGAGTNGSQWFVTEGPTPHLYGRHTVFGRCDDASIEVVKAIARVPVGERDIPVEPVVVEQIAIE